MDRNYTKKHWCDPLTGTMFTDSDRCVFVAVRVDNARDEALISCPLLPVLAGNLLLVTSGSYIVL